MTRPVAAEALERMIDRLLASVLRVKAQ